MILGTPLTFWIHLKSNQRSGKEQSPWSQRSTNNMLQLLCERIPFFIEFAASVATFHFPESALDVWACREKEYILAGVFHYEDCDCELEVEQHKRENSWTNTTRFKPADISPLLKGQIKYCGGFLARGGRDAECVCVGVHATKTHMMFLLSAAPRVGSRISRSLYTLEFVKLFTSVCREWRVELFFLSLFSISNFLQIRFGSSRTLPSSYLGLELV